MKISQSDRKKDFKALFMLCAMSLMLIILITMIYQDFIELGIWDIYLNEVIKKFEGDFL